MATAADPLTITWEHATTEAHWEVVEPPAEAAQLEPLIREAAGRSGVDGLRVRLRQDGTRWRVLAEPASNLESEAHEATKAIVESFRAAGVPAEPGFPADPHQPQLHVNPVE